MNCDRRAIAISETLQWFEYLLLLTDQTAETFVIDLVGMVARP